MTEMTWTAEDEAMFLALQDRRKNEQEQRKQEGISRRYKDAQNLGGDSMRETLISAYLDWKNNYLSVETWAEHNGLTPEEGRRLIELSRDIAGHGHPEE